MITEGSWDSTAITQAEPDSGLYGEMYSEDDGGGFIIIFTDCLYAVGLYIDPDFDQWGEGDHTIGQDSPTDIDFDVVSAGATSSYEAVAGTLSITEYEPLVRLSGNFELEVLEEGSLESDAFSGIFDVPISLENYNF